MPLRHIIQVSEYEKLYYDEATLFTEVHWKALCLYLHQAGRRTAASSSFFQIINKGIRFTNYVGVIQVGNLTIEILPKTDKAGNTAYAENNLQQKDRQRWHTALLQMLSECKWLTAHPAGSAYLGLKKQSILDVYLSVFLAEVEKILHEGLLKKYEPEEGNQSALKGRLLLGRQVVKNAVHSERFYVSNATYDTNTLFNQLLYNALRLVQQISPALQHTAASLLLQFPEMKSVTISDDTFRQLIYNRKTERYRSAIQFAEMLLRHTSPDISGGQMHTLALLFDMNILWEEWIYRRLKKEELRFGISVQRQQTTAFWNAAHLSRPKTIRPDIIIRQGNKTIVVDTKWKLIENSTPADDDLKQLFVYNLYWQCEQVVLLYPANEAKSPVQSHYTAIAGLSPIPCRCLVLLQSIWDVSGKLNTDFGKEVLEKILPS